MTDDRRIEREIMEKVREWNDQALADYKAYVKTLPRRPNKQQAERKAYLHGFLVGVAITYREFEKRQPIEWQETGRQDEEERSDDERSQTADTLA